MPLEEVLRRALGRAGIVNGYVHVCRKKGCGHSEQAPDAGLRRCPVHNHRLWPKAQVRPIRFHDLRHTTGSLLLMAGANPASVQRILRHSDPRVTMDYYGHLLPGYLRDEVDRLQFEDHSKDSQQVAASSTQLVTTLLQPSICRTDQPSDDAEIMEEFREVMFAPPAGIEPATFGLGTGIPIQQKPTSHPVFSARKKQVRPSTGCPIRHFMALESRVRLVT